jgi:hypothetical protein
VSSQSVEQYQARLLLVFAGFHLAFAAARLVLLPPVLASGINLLELSGWHSGPMALQVLYGLAQPLVVSLLLIMASVGVRCATSWGRLLALLAGAADISALVLLASPLPSWSALAVLAAVQGGYIIWKFGIHWDLSNVLE